MKKLHSYIITSFLGPFFAVLFVVVFALSMQFLWVYIDELVGKGLGLGVIMEFMGWAACTLLPRALPLATLLASIMTMGNFGERNELLAMKAAGISLTRIMTPVIVLSFLISIGAFFSANSLVPYAFNKIMTLRADIGRTKDEIKIPTGTFYDGIDGYILRINSTDKKTGMMHDVLVYDHSSNNGNVSMTLADSGRITITPDKQNLIFELFSGCQYQEDNTLNYRDTSLQLNKTGFGFQKLIVPLENYSFTRSEENEYGDDIKTMGLKDLRFNRDSLQNRLDSILDGQYKRFLASGAFERIAYLDTSFSHKELADGFQYDSLMASISPRIEVRAIENAEEKMKEADETMVNFDRGTYRFIEPLRRMRISIFQKFTLSLACLLFFFIGAPLGAIIRKGGLGTPVVISVFFYLLYYVIDMIGEKLARSGAVIPLAGTIISTMVLIPIGWLLTRKSTQDSALFNADSYKEFFRMVKKRISKRFNRAMNHFRKGGAKIRIVYMGTPEFAVAPLDALIQSGYEVAAVVTVPDRPSGRGLNVNESAVKRYAVEHGLPVLQPEKLRDSGFLETLASYNANLFVVVAFRMLPEVVWSMPALGTFNLHASLLPQYRGAAPINWAIINGEKFTGVTTFMIDKEIDTGKIIFQESCAIDEFDDAGSLHDKLMKMGSALVVKTVDAIEDRNIKPYEQDASLLHAIRTAPKLTKETCRIDWSRSAYSINNLIRGLSPYPAAWTLIEKDGQQLSAKIFDAYVVRSQSDAPFGSVTTDGRTYLEIKCGTNALRIVNLQLAGKKRMEVKAFLLGFREPENCRFV